MSDLNENDLGNTYPANETIDDVELISVNEAIRNHPIEEVGKVLRSQMKGMETLAI